MKKRYFIIIIIFCVIILFNISEVKASNTDVSDREIAIAALMIYGKYDEGKTIGENLGNSDGMIYTYSTKHELDDWLVADYRNFLSFTAFVLEKDNNLIIAIRGTDTEIITDALSGFTNFHVYELFGNSYVDEIMKRYSKKEGNYKIHVTGHSLGGYLAQTSGARVAQRQSKYSNLKLAKIVTFNSMGLNFIPILEVLRPITIKELKDLSKQGQLIEYSLWGDLISAGGTHYGEIRTVIPSIDIITEYREKFKFADTAQKILKISNLLGKIFEYDPINIFKTEFDQARDLYQLDSMSGFLDMTHRGDDFTALNLERSVNDVSLSITSSSGEQVKDNITINDSITLKVRTNYASAKEYQWYVSDENGNWGEPIKVSSLYKDTETKVPTNTLKIDIKDIKKGETKYYKVVSCYDDKYTVSYYEIIGESGINNYHDAEVQPECNSGTVETVIAVRREGTLENPPVVEPPVVEPPVEEPPVVEPPVVEPPVEEPPVVEPPVVEPPVEEPPVVEPPVVEPPEEEMTEVEILRKQQKMNRIEKILNILKRLK